MDLPPEQLLELLNQPGMIQPAPARLPCYEKIRVAVLIGFTSGHRAEHAQGGAPRRSASRRISSRRPTRNLSRVTLISLCVNSAAFRAKIPRVTSLKVMNMQIKIG